MILLMYQPQPEHLAKLRQAAPRHRVVWARSQAEARELVNQAEVVLGNRYLVQSLPFAKRLRWVQSNSVGVDLILKEKDLLERNGIVLTSARGVYDQELAEHTLALLLALCRQLPLLRDEQQRQSWRRHALTTIHGSRCLILGWGSLARHIARLLKSMGACVSGARNSPTDTESDGFRVFGSHSWQSRLPNTDALIMCLPLTDATRHLVAEPELSSLPAHAYVVNIGRGGTLDEGALISSLHASKLAGAALDVFEQEPLPANHPLWRESRVIVSPHVGRSLEQPPYRWQTLFEENLARYVSGEPLRNEIDYKKGY